MAIIPDYDFSKKKKNCFFFFITFQKETIEAMIILLIE